MKYSDKFNKKIGVTRHWLNINAKEQGNFKNDSNGILLQNH